MEFSFEQKKPVFERGATTPKPWTPKIEFFPLRLRGKRWAESAPLRRGNKYNRSDTHPSGPAREKKNFHCRFPVWERHLSGSHLPSFPIHQATSHLLALKVSLWRRLHSAAFVMASYVPASTIFLFGWLLKSETSSANMTTSMFSGTNRGRSSIHSSKSSVERTNP